MSNKLSINILRIFLILGLITMSSMIFIIQDVKACESNLILYHKYHEVNNQCFDYSGFNHNGTYHHTTFKNGIFNGCVLFNGLNSYISVNSTKDLSFTNNISDKPFSVSFWIKHEYLISQPVLSKGSYYNNTCEYCIGIDETDFKGYFRVIDSSTGAYLQAKMTNDLSIIPSYNSWIWGFCTYDGSGVATGLKIYVNGNLIPTDNVKVGSVYNNMFNSSENLNIGVKHFTVNKGYLHGSLDELKVYKECITINEITYLYNLYHLTGYTLTLIPVYEGYDKNITVLQNNEYYKTVKFGDNIEVNNTYEYTFIIHEDIKDQIKHIENLNDISKNNVTFLVYILIGTMLFSLIIFVYKRK